MFIDQCCLNVGLRPQADIAGKLTNGRFGEAADGGPGGQVGWDAE